MQQTIDIQAFNRGDEEAFKIFFHQYYSLGMWGALKIVPCLEAEDLVVDAFVKLFQHVKAGKPFDTLTGAKNYFLISVKNSALNKVDKTKRFAKNLKEYTPLEVVEDYIEAIDPIPFIKDLPKECQRIMRLLFIEGKGTHEIAAELNISRQTVLNQKTRAISLLRKKIAYARL